jgi:nicotinamide-nucleotide amidase
VKAEIISIGDELLVGETTDTNAAFIANQLPLLGIDLYWVSQVGDNQPRIVEVLRRAWQRSDLIFTTGGLGPTGDDLTREAIAEMLGEKLEIAPALERDMRERFARWNMPMPLSNLKQAALIPSAQPIPNPQWTAPGWWIEKDGRILVAMPGPPREMNDMWRNEVNSRLQRISDQFILQKTFKTFGLSEAAVGEMSFPLFTLDNPVLGVYAKPDGIQLRIKAKARNQEDAKMMLADGEAKIRGALGEYIWGVDDETLESAVGHLLVEKVLILAVMEDYSGGWLTAGLTDVPDNQRFFRGGLVACSNEAKIAFGVDSQVISRHGAVSAEVAQAMAEAIKIRLKADIGIGITGVEESKAYPSGIVYIGITDGKGSRAINRPRGKRRITSSALFELRKLLLVSD